MALGFWPDSHFPIASPAGQARPGRLAACIHIGPQNGAKKVLISGSTFGPPKMAFP